MATLDEAANRAVRLGRRAANKGRLWPPAMAGGGSSSRTEGAAGRLALEAFREFGEDGMRAVMNGYGAGYNRHTLEPSADREGAA